MMQVLTVVSIIVAGLMVGNELAIAAFVQPTLDRLPDDTPRCCKRCPSYAESISGFNRLSVKT